MTKRERALELRRQRNAKVGVRTRPQPIPGTLRLLALVHALDKAQSDRNGRSGSASTAERNQPTRLQRPARAVRAR